VNLVETLNRSESVPANAWLAALAGWLLPGAGHLLQGRVWRALLLGGVVWLMFWTGVRLGGHIYGFSEGEAGLLNYVFAFCDMGTGVLYFISKAAGVAVAERPELATSEYGNVFLMVAGLLNFLLSLDAFDIGAGRKR
jgi:TM2 domain-containing membrane protein YozV